MPKGELEDHEVCPKNLVLGGDSLETSEAGERLKLFLEWLVLSEAPPNWSKNGPLREQSTNTKCALKTSY